jgi:hypothetical protein
MEELAIQQIVSRAVVSTEIWCGTKGTITQTTRPLGWQ